ncbi:MAG: YjcQ family protein [Caldisericum sp.]|uniref:YjcQ family protein n=1 Tax=Caldisericum sp. TaxID=2499687 RepID=UPI003D0FE7E3
MEMILREEYLKVLAAIYYHFVKEHSKVDISTLSNELNINEEILANDIRYLNDKGYIIGVSFVSGLNGTIIYVHEINPTPKGRDIIEDPFKFVIGDKLSNFFINTGSITGSNISQSNVSNISIENINMIEKQADSLIELVSEEKLKKEIENSKESTMNNWENKKYHE